MVIFGLNSRTIGSFRPKFGHFGFGHFLAKFGHFWPRSNFGHFWSFLIILVEKSIFDFRVKNWLSRSSKWSFLIIFDFFVIFGIFVKFDFFVIFDNFGWVGSWLLARPDPSQFLRLQKLQICNFCKIAKIAILRFFRKNCDFSIFSQFSKNNGSRQKLTSQSDR